MTWDRTRVPRPHQLGGAAVSAPRAPADDQAGAPRDKQRKEPRAGRSPGTAALVAADCAAAVAAYWVVRPDAGPPLLGPLLAALLLAHRRAGLYRPGLATGALDELPALAQRTALVWGLVAVAVAAVAPGRALGWGELPAGIAVTVLMAITSRALVHRRRRAVARRRPASTLIVGTGPAVRQIAAILHAHPEYGMRPVGIASPEGPRPRPQPPTAAAVDDAGREAAACTLLAVPDPAPDPAAPPRRLVRPADPAAPAAHDRTPPQLVRLDVPGPPQTGPDVDLPVLPVLVGEDDVVRAVIQNAVRCAVVAGRPALFDARTAATVRVLAQQGCRVWELVPGRGEPGHLWGFACRQVAVEPYPAAVRWGKRALDTSVAAAALVLLAPVLAGCALAVRLADGPGVIFRQERIGRAGRPFTLLKFRTLRPRDEHEAATRWSVAGDWRMSRVGRLLRRSSLDELPQLWNVLRGDMSLVGPRPERPYFVGRFSQAHPGYADRHRMPVGITGLAQIHGLRGDTSIADRARFDNHYIDSWSLWQDVSILLRTIGSFFRHGGS